MKPVALYMKNFKSYGEDTPVFDFNAFDIVLLTGENGNGKSSIADAIAWCIWGQCKGMTGRGGIDDLVRSGAEDMEVSFTFEEDGNQYKIIRKRDKRRGQSSLDLFIEEGGVFTPISGNRIDETQSKIQQLIKLDYDTYLCTAYLSQGKADMFAIKKPNERKEVLSEILNLSSYDRLAELAKEERGGLQSEAEILKREVYGLEARVGDEDKVSKARDMVEEELRTRQKKEQAIGERLDAYYKTYREKSSLIKSLEGYRGNLERVKEELQQLKKEEAQLLTRIKSYREVLKREEEIEISYKRARELSERENLYREKLQERTTLIRQLDIIDSTIDKKRQELEYNIKLLQQEIESEKRKLYREDKVAKEVKSFSDALKKMVDLEKRLYLMERDVKKNIEEIAALRAREGSLLESLDDLRKRYKDLSGAKSNCPTCYTPLTDSSKANVLKTMAENGKNIQEDLENTQNSIRKLDKERKGLEREIDKAKTVLKNKGKVESHLAIMQRELEEAEEAKKRIEALMVKLIPLKENMADKTYASELLADKRKLQEEMSKLDYDEDIHRKIREELKELAHIGESYQEVQLAKVRLSADEESINRIRALIEARESYGIELTTLIGQLEKATEGIETIKKDIYGLEMEKKKMGDEIRQLQSKKGALDERLKQIEDAKREIKEKKNAILELNREIELYSTLIEIYGKRGIQAAIIENAIPELQDETNRILAKITDGRLTVEFLTQRDTKAGNTVETLDIKISDGLDTRKYETYSGGEEFRINFAIRIALSKILARRAGATVRMLVLDEGFGTLDEKGRERLAQVINAISDEFEKIIVITHIQDLKDYFSNQIEVYMTPKGSMFKPL